MSQRLRVLEEFRVELDRLEHRQPARARRLARPRLVVVGSLLVILALATGALAASGVFSTGAPVKPSAKDLVKPRSGGGAVIASSVGPLVARAADPAGGPDWGIRSLKTTRGLGCLQVGRVVGGRLGVLGEDGAFGNDGRFHPLPPPINESPADCSALDAHGQLFLAFESQGVPASGDPTACTEPGGVQAHPTPALCPIADERAIYAGTLGPSALTITYTGTHNVARTMTLGPDGSYLIVTRADPSLQAGENFTGVLPSYGNGDPITSITYRGGEHCTLRPGRWTNADGAPCDPVGYIASKLTTPSPKLLATTIHHTLLLDTLVHGHRADELLVSFKAKAAVQSATSAYALYLQLPDSGTCQGNGTATLTNGDITAGQTAHLNLIYAHPAGQLHCPGLYTGAVYYARSNTASPDGIEIPLPGHPINGSKAVIVGRFTFRVK